MSASRVAACAGLAVAALLSALARADDAAVVVQGAPVRLEFTSPAGCPDASDFARKVADRAPHFRRANDDERALVVRGAVRAAASGVVGRLELIEPDGRSSDRTLDAADCRQATDALALITALAIERPDDTPTTSAVPPAPTASATPSASPSPSSAQPLQAPPPSPSTPSPSPTVPLTRAAPASPPRASSAHTGISSVSDARSRNVEQPRGPRPIWSFDGAVAAFGALGLAPGPTVGGTLAAGVAVDRPGSAWSPSVRLGIAATLDCTFSEPGGRVTFGWLAVRIDACPLALRLGGTRRLLPCLAGEYGVLSARGSNTHAPESWRRPWASAGLALRYVMAIVAPVRLEAGLEALASIERDRFSLGGDEVFVVPPIHGKLVAGIGF